MAVKAVLTRLKDDGKQTLGRMQIFDGLNLAFGCCTLELPWKDNQRRISCVPAGKYEVVKRNDPNSKYDYEHLHVLNVPERDWILMHIGNFNWQIMGCILPGSHFHRIDNNAELDVANSRLTLNQLLKTVPESFTLHIVGA